MEEKIQGLLVQEMFLHEDLDEEVCMTGPPSISAKDCRLVKTI